MIEKTDTRKAAMDALESAGRGMSNICFNLSQEAYIPASVRMSMRKAQDEWDLALRALIDLERQETPPPSSHVEALDAHSQSLLAAQNNVIDGLIAENNRLRKALAPFAEVADRFDGVPVSAILPQQCWFTPHSLREARAALSTPEGSTP